MNDHDPIREPKNVQAKRRWLWSTAALLIACALGYWICLRLDAAALAELRQLKAKHGEQSEEKQRLEARLAIVEAGTEVTAAANRQLRNDLLQMEQSLDASRADLNFYRRLLSAGLEKGLGVHEMRLLATASPQVFHFELTLALNSRQPGPASGQVELVVHGIESNQPVTLDMAKLTNGVVSAGLDYEFRYFQQLRGDITVPAEFFPERLTVIVKPQARGEAVEHEYQWFELFEKRANS